jgi:S-DNA-T family DNA segregation ATPase FtsK/SpoIIIE
MGKSKTALEKFYADEDWIKFKDHPVIPLGFQNENDHKIIDLKNCYFNLLVAGKSNHEMANFFHCAIVNLLRKNNPKGIASTRDLKLILIGKKKTEFELYNNLPHLLFPVIQNPGDAKEAVQWSISELERRRQLYLLFPGIFQEYNQARNEKLPRIVVFIEDLSDLMKNNQTFYNKAFNEICFSSLKDIHFIAGVSKPSKLTPKKIIKHFYFRIAFASATAADSKAIIGKEGAEKLTGKGKIMPIRFGELHDDNLQGYQITKKEVKSVVSSITKANKN